MWVGGWGFNVVPPPWVFSKKSENPDLGMTVGQPELKKGDVFYNFGLPFNDGKNKLYSFVKAEHLLGLFILKFD